jgi:hypothetical protein
MSHTSSRGSWLSGAWRLFTCISWTFATAQFAALHSRHICRRHIVVLEPSHNGCTYYWRHIRRCHCCPPRHEHSKRNEFRRAHELQPHDTSSGASAQHRRVARSHPQPTQPKRHPFQSKTHVSWLQKHHCHLASNRRDPSHDQAPLASPPLDFQDPVLPDHHCRPPPSRRPTSLPQFRSSRDRTPCVFFQVSQSSSA